MYMYMCYFVILGYGVYATVEVSKNPPFSQFQGIFSTLLTSREISKKSASEKAMLSCEARRYFISNFSIR